MAAWIHRSHIIKGLVRKIFWGHWDSFCRSLYVFKIECYDRNFIFRKIVLQAVERMEEIYGSEGQEASKNDITFDTTSVVSIIPLACWINQYLYQASAMFKGLFRWICEKKNTVYKRIYLSFCSSKIIYAIRSLVNILVPLLSVNECWCVWILYVFVHCIGLEWHGRCLVSSIFF